MKEDMITTEVDRRQLDGQGAMYFRMGAEWMAQKNGQMISVKEQMPPSQVEVLLYDTAGYYRTGYWHDGLKRWCGRDVPQYAVITHWCHLPKRPENREDCAQNSYFY